MTSSLSFKNFFVITAFEKTVGNNFPRNCVLKNAKIPVHKKQQVIFFKQHFLPSKIAATSNYRVL